MTTESIRIAKRRTPTTPFITPTTLFTAAHLSPSSLPLPLNDDYSNPHDGIQSPELLEHLKDGGVHVTQYSHYVSHRLPANSYTYNLLNIHTIDHNNTNNTNNTASSLTRRASQSHSAPISRRNSVSASLSSAQPPEPVTEQRQSVMSERSDVDMKSDDIDTTDESYNDEVLDAVVSLPVSKHFHHRRCSSASSISSTSSVGSSYFPHLSIEKLWQQQELRQVRQHATLGQRHDLIEQKIEAEQQAEKRFRAELWDKRQRLIEEKRKKKLEVIKVKEEEGRRRGEEAEAELRRQQQEAEAEAKAKAKAEEAVATAAAAGTQASTPNNKQKHSIRTPPSSSVKSNRLSNRRSSIEQQASNQQRKKITQSTAHLPPRQNHNSSAAQSQTTSVKSSPSASHRTSGSATPVVEVVKSSEQKQWVKMKQNSSDNNSTQLSRQPHPPVLNRLPHADTTPIQHSLRQKRLNQLNNQFHNLNVTSPRPSARIKPQDLVTHTLNRATRILQQHRGKDTEKSAMDAVKLPPVVGAWQTESNDVSPNRSAANSRPTTSPPQSTLHPTQAQVNTRFIPTSFRQQQCVPPSPRQQLQPQRILHSPRQQRQQQQLQLMKDETSIKALERILKSMHEERIQTEDDSMTDGALHCHRVAESKDVKTATQSLAVPHTSNAPLSLPVNFNDFAAAAASESFQQTSALLKQLTLARTSLEQQQAAEALKSNLTSQNSPRLLPSALLQHPRVIPFREKRVHFADEQQQRRQSQEELIEVLSIASRKTQSGHLAPGFAERIELQPRGAEAKLKSRASTLPHRNRDEDERQ